MIRLGRTDAPTCLSVDCFCRLCVFATDGGGAYSSAVTRNAPQLQSRASAALDSRYYSDTRARERWRLLACVASAGGRACVAHSGSLTPLPAPPHRVDMAIVSHASSLTLPALRRVQTDGEARHVLSLHKVRPASALWPAGEREIVAGIPTPLLAISPTSHALECSHVNVSVWIAPQRQFLVLFSLFFLRRSIFFSDLGLLGGACSSPLTKLSAAALLHKRRATATRPKPVLQFASPAPRCAAPPFSAPFVPSLRPAAIVVRESGCWFSVPPARAATFRRDFTSRMYECLPTVSP